MLTSKNSNYINIWPCMRHVIKDVLTIQLAKNINQTISQKKVNIKKFWCY